MVMVGWGVGFFCHHNLKLFAMFQFLTVIPLQVGFVSHSHVRHKCSFLFSRKWYTETTVWILIAFFSGYI